MKNIDLSWSGLFGGEGNGARRENKKVWWLSNHKRPIHISMLLNNINVNNTPLHKDQGIDIENWIDTHYKIFKNYPKKYEPYYNFEENNLRCDCCGQKIHLLNSKYFLCDNCNVSYHYQEYKKRLPIFEGSSINMSDNSDDSFDLVIKKNNKSFLKKIKRFLKNNFPIDNIT